MRTFEEYEKLYVEDPKSDEKMGEVKTSNEFRPRKTQRLLDHKARQAGQQVAKAKRDASEAAKAAAADLRAEDSIVYFYPSYEMMNDVNKTTVQYLMKNWLDGNRQSGAKYMIAVKKAFYMEDRQQESWEAFAAELDKWANKSSGGREREVRDV